MEQKRLPYPVSCGGDHEFRFVQSELGGWDMSIWGNEHSFVLLGICKHCLCAAGLRRDGTWIVFPKNAIPGINV